MDRCASHASRPAGRFYRHARGVARIDEWVAASPAPFLIHAMRMEIGRPGTSMQVKTWTPKAASTRLRLLYPTPFANPSCLSRRYTGDDDRAAWTRSQPARSVPARRAVAQ